jgi:hypothetical protein
MSRDNETGSYKYGTRFSVLVEVEASDLFDGENVNWRYCVDHATFVHHDKDACEFILHIGGGPGSESYADDIIAEMTAYGCTPAFIDAYTEARDAGALRVLFHA